MHFLFCFNVTTVIFKVMQPRCVDTYLNEWNKQTKWSIWKNSLWNNRVFITYELISILFIYFNMINRNCFIVIFYIALLMLSSKTTCIRMIVFCYLVNYKTVMVVKMWINFISIIKYYKSLKMVENNNSINSGFNDYKTEQCNFKLKRS